jgi:replicative DNA helicase
MIRFRLATSDLIIIAARPAMGKTAFVLSMARNMAIDLECQLPYFLEMASVQANYSFDFF